MSDRDAGLTLLELLIASTIALLLIGVSSMVFTSSLKLNQATQDTFASANDVQFTGTRFVTDVQNAAGLGSTNCNSGTLVVSLRQHDGRVVSYSYWDGRLMRRDCSTGQERPMARHLAGLPAVDCGSDPCTQFSRVVTLTMTTVDGRTRSLTGTRRAA